MQIWSNIVNNFKQGSYHTRLLYINLGVFASVSILILAFKLLGTNVSWVVRYLEMPAYVGHWIYQPWSILTYMFLHLDFIHFIFNALALYWFGTLFSQFFSQKQLVGVYILGGIGGALLYVLGYSFLPYFSVALQQSYLLGASASVMAIIFATVLYAPNFEISLVLIGKVKLKYIGLALFGIDLLGITSVNAGGSIAHIGGALTGIVFTYLYVNKQIDLSNGISWILNKTATRFAPKPKIKVSYGNAKTDAEWNLEKKAKNDAIDIILEQIKKSGYDNLTSEQKKILFDISKKN
ncbi:MAG: rhomboid family intramembrane serine protease [Paludibacteraceae bacterium]|nr:rhomboid family intramembrane serine protease [Paludibacteraceae bacterium]MBP6284871.1 rhomboid family intramembrane serine protease [Paludibacteraceae bacterium]